MDNLESGESGAALAGGIEPRSPDDEGEAAAGLRPAEPASGPVIGPSDVSVPGADTPLVWPPPDEDVDQVQVVEMDWQRAEVAAPSTIRLSDSDRSSNDSANPASASTAIAADAPDAVPELPRDSRVDQREPLASDVQPTLGRYAALQATKARRGARWWLVATVVLAIGVGLAIGWYVRPMVAPASTTASLSIEATTSEADVSIDGTPRGRVPVRVTLPPGEHRLAVSSGGVTREVSVLLNAGADVVRVFDFPRAETTSTGTGGTYGSLNVQTRPAGAQVVIAGQARGQTPLTIANLPAGPVDVELVLFERRVTQQVDVQPGKEALLVVPMAGAASEPGWIAVRSQIPLRILEGGRVVGTTDSERIMLSGGRHNLELVNEPLEVRLPRQVVVLGGREVPIDVTPPLGLVNINARPWAEVFARGNRLGETPLGNVSLPVGDHELVFRHPQFGERRQVVTVRATTPARVSVAFTP